MTTVQADQVDIKTTLAAAVDALGVVMLEMQRRRLLAQSDVSVKTRHLLSAKTMTDEQIGDLTGRAFESGASALAQIGYPGATVFNCNPSEEI